MPHSISGLTEGTNITRQAVTRHLSVLEAVGLVTKLKAGRETLYELDGKPLRLMEKYLQTIASQWDRSLNDLKTFLEDEEN
jgi:DNA-binding transcriptional ArsR family regulator